MILIKTTSDNHDFSDNHGGQDIGLVKLNSRREVEWKKSIGDTLEDYFKKCIQYKNKFYLHTISHEPVDPSGNGVYHVQSTLTVLNDSGRL